MTDLILAKLEQFLPKMSSPFSPVVSNFVVDGQKERNDLTEAAERDGYSL